MQNPIVSLYYSFPMCPMWFKHNSEVEKTFFEGYAENIVPNVDYQGKQDDLESKLVLNNELLNVGWYRETRGRIPSQHIKHYLRSKEYGGLSGNNPWGNDDSSSSDNNQSQNAEDKQYYFHPDHLGSTNYLTDVTGEAYQHVAYLPWGEVFVEERNTQTSRNTFLYTGKELDEMTGLYYYEQRYYDPNKSTFLGVDQLTDKYPHISGFAYVANNPLVFVDPDGRQSIHHSKSRIVSKNGKISLKLENLHRYTRNHLLSFNNNSLNWKKGEIGISMEVAFLRFQPIPLPSPGNVTIDGTHGTATGNPSEHSVKNPTTKSSNYTQTDRRYKPRTISGASGMTKGAARGILVLDLAIYGFQLAGTWSVLDDLNKMRKHLDVLQESINMVNNAIISGLIPEQYQNQESILDILNVVYQGENTTKDENIMNIGIEILKENKIYDQTKIKKSED